jgi:hypothetical protein
MFPPIMKQLQVLLRFSRYKPKKVTLRSIQEWLKQFPGRDHDLLLRLMLAARFVSEREALRLLVERNMALLRRLGDAGIPHNKIIYMQFDDAGSSSTQMLGLLKEHALLERSGCHFLDAKDVLGISKKTREVGDGAVIYVDDFIGTGKQFCGARDFAHDFFQGTFSEFLLSACICEEAFYKLGERGIEASAGFVHPLNDRALHPYSNVFSQQERERLLELGRTIDKRWSLGFNNVGTMVVLYRNTPNSVPLLLRGNVGQRPYFGIVPRTTDLPASSPGQHSTYGS